MENETTDIKLSKSLAQEAERSLSVDGISLDEAIKIFLTQIIRHNGKPLSEWISIIPNKETLAALEEAERIAYNPNIKSYKTTEELKADLPSDDE